MEGHPAEAGKDPGLVFSPVLRGAAYLLSVIFHPLFIPLLVTLLLMYTHPIQFADFSGKAKLAILGPVIENTIILPLAVVLLLKPLGFADSIQLKSRRDRIIPYAATMIFYYWLFRVSVYQSSTHEQFPAILAIFILGNFIAVILASLANIMMKPSLHALGMGSLLGILIQMAGDPFINVGVLLMLAVLLTGLVSTSRLILEAHRSREIYWGLGIGLISQLAALFFF